ncbi:MAG TPA: hypothetical protein VMW10_02255 [Alphaproteobacteria bacterium]|nr:hypothetical protein [Alphaproteobacteria bacterium]
MSKLFFPVVSLCGSFLLVPPVLGMEGLSELSESTEFIRTFTKDPGARRVIPRGESPSNSSKPKLSPEKPEGSSKRKFSGIFKRKPSESPVPTSPRNTQEKPVKPKQSSFTSQKPSEAPAPTSPRGITPGLQLKPPPSTPNRNPLRKGDEARNTPQQVALKPKPNVGANLTQRLQGRTNALEKEVKKEVELAEQFAPIKTLSSADIEKILNASAAFTLYENNEERWRIDVKSKQATHATLKKAVCKDYVDKFLELKSQAREHSPGIYNTGFDKNDSTNYITHPSVEAHVLEKLGPYSGNTVKAATRDNRNNVQGHMFKFQLKVKSSNDQYLDLQYPNIGFGMATMDPSFLTLTATYSENPTQDK